MSTTTRLTVAQYEEMIRRGAFEPREEHHVELIRGEVVPMSPIGPPHVYLVALLNEWSFAVLPPGAVLVSVQGAVAIPPLDSEPQPDLVWVRRREGYWSELPRPGDVLLIVEVADTSLTTDRGVKARLYAEAGLADYWVVDVAGRRVEVFRDPDGASYRSATAYHPGEEVRPLAFPDAVLPVSRIFPGGGGRT